MKQLISTYTAYNVWANKTLINYLLLKPESLIDTELTGSFTTIRKTFYHIWDAEVIWLKRLQGESISDWPSKTYDNAFEGWYIYMINHSSSFHSILENKPENYFTRQCKYRSLEGTEHTQLNAEIILHCMNHSTYHRGQIINMLHQLKIKSIPSTDLIYFLRENNQ